MSRENALTKSDTETRVRDILGKFAPPFVILRSLFIHPQSLASLPVIGRRNIAGLREKGVDVREPVIPS